MFNRLVARLIVLVGLAFSVALFIGFVYYILRLIKWALAHP
jgi:hypothetical protein